jgi:hypothetical protein
MLTKDGKTSAELDGGKRSQINKARKTEYL